jgi:hypothetical protein
MVAMLEIQNFIQEPIAAVGVSLGSDFSFSTPALNCLIEGKLTEYVPYLM